MSDKLEKSIGILFIFFYCFGDINVQTLIKCKTGEAECCAGSLLLLFCFRVLPLNHLHRLLIFTLTSDIDTFYEENTRFQDEAL